MIIEAVILICIASVMLMTLLVRIEPAKDMPRSYNVPGKGLVAFHPEGYIETEDEELITFFDDLEGYLVDGNDSTVTTPTVDDVDTEEEEPAGVEAGDDPATWDRKDLFAYVKKHKIKVADQKSATLIKAIRKHLGMV